MCVPGVTYLGADHKQTCAADILPPESRLPAHRDDALRGDGVGQLPHSGLGPQPHGNVETFKEIGMTFGIGDDHTCDQTVRGERFPHRLASLGEEFPRQFAAAPVPQPTN